MHLPVFVKHNPETGIRRMCFMQLLLLANNSFWRRIEKCN